MRALMMRDGEAGGTTSLERARLDPAGLGHDEKWLQALLYAHPELVPLDIIDPGAGRMVPICRELTVPKAGASVFLDILGVTPQGRLVLIECKLWRNPQARREVVAQILEYAALVRQWSYGDLTARIKAATKLGGANPLYDLVSQQVPGIDEANFVDQVSRSLSLGDFLLVIAGDGIRSDLQAISAHLNSNSGLVSRLALVEYQLWIDGNGQTLVVPSVPLRTEIVQQRVVVAPDGSPITLQTDQEDVSDAEAAIDPESAAKKEKDRAFWQRFIDEAVFDHPDQPAPRNGAPGWVKLDMPKPATWLTVYRRAPDGEAGVVLRLRNEDGAEVYQMLNMDRASLEAEVGTPLTFKQERDNPFVGEVAARLYREGDDEVVLSWLKDKANSMASALRTRMSPLK